MVEQPDGTRSNAVRVELLGEVVTHAQEVRVEYDEEYVQAKNTHYRQAMWRRRVVVNALVAINEVALRRAPVMCMLNHCLEWDM